MRKISILLFIFLTFSADLKVTVFPFIHWIAWALLIFPYMMKDFFKKGIKVSPFLGIGVLTLLLGILTSSINSPDYEFFVQMTKLLLIFLTMYYFLNYETISLKIMFFMFNILVIANFLFLMMGLAGFPTAWILTADGRWGTILNYPGSLVKIGSLAFFLNIMLVVFTKKFIYFIMMTLSLVIVYMDGSRTGMLLIILTLILVPIFYIVGNFKDKIKVIIVPVLVVFLFTVAILINIKLFLGTRIGESILSILNSESLSVGLEAIDPARYMMLIAALEKIIENPLVGTGAFTTVAIYTDGSSMVVHNTYLQAWGDFGLLGVLSLTLISCGWIYLLPNALKKIQVINNGFMKAIFCSSIMMLLYYVLSGLFHPYSTEFSEWMTFILPMTAYLTLYKKFGTK
ncbi:O-antigen ligase family protein [Psychrobacillus sp. PGGUH221]|uniref:O-antigen ligase family protein n=1 Tax=Psychrobacillus sp. PGGUH221 TaxID=3020058 RepID=UPI0035C76E24